VLLLDEFDLCPPKVIGSILSVLDGTTIEINGKQIQLDPPDVSVSSTRATHRTNVTVHGGAGCVFADWMTNILAGGSWLWQDRGSSAFQQLSNVQGTNTSLFDFMQR
jgi:hypothetical protein